METPKSHLPANLQSELSQCVSRLEKALGENLHSLVLYGSSVRGGYDPGASDINLLIVLEASTAHAHRAIREALASEAPFEPFIVEWGEMPRAGRVFALKFMSIQRDYTLLSGTDPFAEFSVSQDLLVMLTEQELRNLRMRLTRAYVTAGPQHRRYRQLLAHQSSRILISLSDCLRCARMDMPQSLPDRIPLFEKLFDADVQILRDLLELRQREGELSEDEAFECHIGLVRLLKSALAWMEKEWGDLPL